MPQANPPTQPISTPTAQHAGSPSYASIPVIIWGAANDYAYNGSGGPSLPYGPFNTTVLRVALSASDSVRIARGDSTVALTSGNVATQAALVTDAHIDAAISSEFNSFFRTPAS